MAIDANAFDGLSADIEGAVLYVWGADGAPKGGTLRTLVPLALEAVRCGAAKVEIELPSRHRIGCDEVRQLIVRWVGGAPQFVVDRTAARIHHQPSGAYFQIESDDSLTLLSDRRSVAASDWPLIEAGAAEMLWQERHRDQSNAGSFVWVQA